MFSAAGQPNPGSQHIRCRHNETQWPHQQRMRQPALSSLLVRVCRQNVKHDLNYTKWVLLVFVILELVSLLIAFVMRCCVDPDGHYGNFEDEEVGIWKRLQSTERMHTASIRSITSRACLVYSHRNSHLPGWKCI